MISKSEIKHQHKSTNRILLQKLASFRKQMSNKYDSDTYEQLDIRNEDIITTQQVHQIMELLGISLTQGQLSEIEFYTQERKWKSVHLKTWVMVNYSNLIMRTGKVRRSSKCTTYKNRKKTPCFMEVLKEMYPTEETANMHMDTANLSQHIDIGCDDSFMEDEATSGSHSLIVNVQKKKLIDLVDQRQYTYTHTEHSEEAVYKEDSLITQNDNVTTSIPPLRMIHKIEGLSPTFISKTRDLRADRSATTRRVFQPNIIGFKSRSRIEGNKWKGELIESERLWKGGKHRENQLHKFLDREKYMRRKGSGANGSNGANGTNGTNGSSNTQQERSILEVKTQEVTLPEIQEGSRGIINIKKSNKILRMQAGEGRNLSPMGYKPQGYIMGSVHRCYTKDVGNKRHMQDYKDRYHTSIQTPEPEPHSNRSPLPTHHSQLDNYMKTHNNNSTEKNIGLQTDVEDLQCIREGNHRFHNEYGRISDDILPPASPMKKVENSEYNIKNSISKCIDIAHQNKYSRHLFEKALNDILTDSPQRIENISNNISNNILNNIPNISNILQGSSNRTEKLLNVNINNQGSNLRGAEYAKIFRRRMLKRYKKHIKVGGDEGGEVRLIEPIRQYWRKHPLKTNHIIHRPICESAQDNTNNNNNYYLRSSRLLNYDKLIA